MSNNRGEKKLAEAKGIAICFSVVSLILIGSLAIVAYFYKNDFVYHNLYDGPIIGMTDPDSVTIKELICHSKQSRKAICGRIGVLVNYTVNEADYQCKQSITFVDNHEEDDFLKFLRSEPRESNVFFGYDDPARCYHEFDAQRIVTDDFGYFLGMLFLSLFSLVSLFFLVVHIYKYHRLKGGSWIWW